MSQALFEASLDSVLEPIFTIFGHMTQANRQVMGLITPDLRSNEDRRGDLFQAIRAHYHARMAEIGAGVIDLTEDTCDANGVLRHDFWAEDPKDIVHANRKWGKAVSRAWLQVLGI